MKDKHMPSNPMSSTASAKGKGPDRSKKMVLRSIEIKPVENGYTVETTNGEDGKEFYNTERQVNVFEDAESMMAHLSKCLDCGVGGGGKGKTSDHGETVLPMNSGGRKKAST